MPKVYAGQRPSPAVIRVDIFNNLVYETFHSACPETHFQCANNGYCLPVFMRCNEVYDCPMHEDEFDCENSQCPGFYRCYDSRTCLHSSHLCDGILQCPRDDDELFCLLQTLECPINCSCYGFAFICRGMNSSLEIGHSGHETEDDISSILKELRYLHISDSVVYVENISNMHFLVHLGLPHCGLHHFPDVNLPSLHSLELSDNHVQELAWLQPTRYKHLRVLALSGNPLDQQVLVSLEHGHSRLLTLDLSHIPIQHLKIGHFRFATNLKALNLSQCEIFDIYPDHRGALTNLMFLDLSGSVVSNFPPDVFYSMSDLARVWTNNPKLCCPALFQKTTGAVECLTSVPVFMSCETLLQTGGYRVVLFLFAVLALFGNIFSFFIRVFVEKATVTHGFAVFVTHLSVSDFLMGVYLAIIGIADQIYQEDYFWQDQAWTQSAACKTAGFLCLLSSEVSAFLIALITLDRYLVFRFPFRHIRFSVTSATTTVAIVWLVGLILSAVPLLPATSHWRVYSETATCFSLPFVTDFDARDYIFSVLIVVNFAVFCFVAVGQASIYLTIRANSMPLQSSQSQKRDINIARRLVAIAVSDFLCWFPVGLLGVLSSAKMHVPRDLNMVVTISVMPLNSALNPFWYTMNLALEKIRIQREQRILTTLRALPLLTKKE